MCVSGRVRDKGSPARPYGSWRGSRVFVIASGPSLTQEDARLTEGKGRVIAVNNSITIAPHADMLYAGDTQWWLHNESLWRKFTGLRATSSIESATRNDLMFVPRGTDDGVSMGGNSGHQAVSLAYLLGAVEIVLLGFDMMADGARNHWHEDHKKITNPSRSLYKGWRVAMHDLVVSLAAKGVSVVNATRRTALEVPRIRIEDLQ